MIVSDTGRWAPVPEWVLRTVSPRALQLYVVLSLRADRDGQSFPSRKTIATEMDCTLRTVDTARDELLAAGALSVDRREARGGHTSSVYTIRRVQSVAGGSAVDCTRGSAVDCTPGTRVSTELENVPSERSRSSAETARGEAQALTCAWWESHDPRPLMRFPAALKIVEHALTRFDASTVAGALRRVGPRITEWKLEDACRAPATNNPGLANILELRAMEHA